MYCRPWSQNLLAGLRVQPHQALGLRRRIVVLQPRVHRIRAERPVLGVAGELEQVHADETHQQQRHYRPTKRRHSDSTDPHGITMHRRRNYASGCKTEARPASASLLTRRVALLRRGPWSSLRAFLPASGRPPMLTLLATLVVTALPATPGAFSACPDPMPATADVGAGECERSRRSISGTACRASRSQIPAAPPPDRPPAPAGQPRRGVVPCPDRRRRSCRRPHCRTWRCSRCPACFPLHVPSHFDADARDLPARAIAPPERPPRA